MIPCIHDSILVDFLDESHRLLLQYVRRSDLITQQETQQQQPYLHLRHPSHQQPFLADDMQFQQPFSTNQQATQVSAAAYHVSPLLSSPASQHHRSPTCSITSASCDSFTQQHMYSDHFCIFYSNLWHLRPISDDVLSRWGTAGDASDTFHFLPVWRECEPEHSSTGWSDWWGLELISSHFIGSF